MLALEIYLNGHRVCSGEAPMGKPSVALVIVTSAKYDHSDSPRSLPTEGTDDGEHVAYSVKGGISEPGEPFKFLHWAGGALRAGDEISLRVVSMVHR
jgi:hypothetical protein